MLFHSRKFNYPIYHRTGVVYVPALIPALGYNYWMFILVLDDNVTTDETGARYLLIKCGLFYVTLMHIVLAEPCPHHEKQDAVITKCEVYKSDIAGHLLVEVGLRVTMFSGYCLLFAVLLFSAKCHAEKDTPPGMNTYDTISYIVSYSFVVLTLNIALCIIIFLLISF